MDESTSDLAYRILVAAKESCGAHCGPGQGVPQAKLKVVSLGIADRLTAAERMDPAHTLWVAANRLSDSDPKGTLDPAVGRGAGMPTPPGTLPLWPKEVLIDLVVFRGHKHPYEPVVTIESEGSIQASKALVSLDVASSPESWEPNGLVWDLFKLLLVASPHRMFVARCDRSKMPHLVERIGRYIETYYPSAADSRAGLFSLVLVSPEKDASPHVRVVVWPAGRWGAEGCSAAAPLGAG